MSTILTAKTNAIAKIDLGRYGGTRRINLSRLYNPTTSQASFSILSTLTLRHSTIPCPHLYRPVVTYTDVDGDEITISTHRELTEAFEQVVDHPQTTGVTTAVLKMKAVFVKRLMGVTDAEMERRMEDKVCVGAYDAGMGFMVDESEGGRWAHMQFVIDSFMTNMKDAVEGILNDAEELRVAKAVTAIEDEVPASFTKVVVGKTGELESASRSDVDEDNLVVVENTACKQLENDIGELESTGSSEVDEANLVVAKDTACKQLEIVTEPSDTRFKDKYTQTLPIDISENGAESDDSKDWEVLDD